MKPHPKIDAAANVLITTLGIPVLAFGLMTALYGGWHLTTWIADWIREFSGPFWAAFFQLMAVFGTCIAAVVLPYQCSRKNFDGRKKERNPKKGFILAAAFLFGLPLLGTPLAAGIKHFSMVLFLFFMSVTGSPAGSLILAAILWGSIIAGLILGSQRFQLERAKLQRQPFS